MENKNPLEVCTSKEPCLSHQRVFGCVAYVYIPKEKRIKLDRKFERCIFIGDNNGLKGYKFCNPEKRKVLYSQDVVFREDKYVIKQKVLQK